MYLKSEQDISAMRKAGELTARILEDMTKLAVSGISTGELDRFAESRCKELNCIPAFKGYRGFRHSVCISVNEEAIHGVPSDTKFLRSGDIVGLDFGVIYNGWYGDSARTIGVGKISDSAQQLLDVTRECLNRGIAKCRVGNVMSDIGTAIQEHAEDAGYAIVRRYCGHGIGRDLHEEPNVFNFHSKGDNMKLEVGMVLAIEPMVNAGSSETKTLSDGWTVVTADGSLSAHFEHTVAITPDGPEILTRY
jgi:methionyl aminopeptidase